MSDELELEVKGVAFKVTQWPHVWRSGPLLLRTDGRRWGAYFIMEDTTIKGAPVEEPYGFASPGAALAALRSRLKEVHFYCEQSLLLISE